MISGSRKTKTIKERDQATQDCEKSNTSQKTKAKELGYKTGDQLGDKTRDERKTGPERQLRPDRRQAGR